MATAREEPQHVQHNSRIQVKISEDLLCALCGDLFADPRILPCLHSFCRRCLEHTVNPRSASITCHICRKEILLQSRGVTDFPPNFIVNNMMDLAAVRNSDKKPILCSSCNEQLPATARCSECMDFLCYACHNAHGRVRLTKDHQVLTLDQLRNSEEASRLLHRPIFCKEHPSEKVRYYCITCQITICRDCTVSNHATPQHDYTSLQNAFDSQRQDLISLHRALQQKLPILSRACGEVDDTSRKLDARSDMIRSEIQERTPGLMRALQEREGSLLSNLDDLVSNKKRVLQKQKDQIEQELKRLSSTSSFTDKVLTHGSEAEVLSLKKQLHENLRELMQVNLRLEPDENAQLNVDTNADSLVSAIKLYGKITTNEVEVLRCGVVGDIETAVKGQYSQVSLVVRNQYGIERKTSKDNIAAELQTPDTGIIIPEVREKLDGTYTLSYRTYSVGRHQLIVRFNGQHILGSPFVVNVVDDTTATAAASHHSPIKISSYSNATNSMDHRVLTNSYSDPYNQKRFVRVVGRRGADYGEFNGVFDIAVDLRLRRIIATDYNNHRVQVFDEEGKFLFLVGERGLGDGQFQSPTGVGVGPGSEIIVCERLKGRIQVFSSDGAFQRRYLLNELKASTLTVDRNGRIIIADYTNCCIYILDPILERWSKFGVFGYGPGELQYPCYVSTNTEGHIYVSDMHSNKIHVFDSDGMFKGSYGRKGDNDGELLRPTGIAVDHKGRLFVADRDNHRIQVFTHGGDFFMKFGSKGDREGELNDPHGLAVLSDGKIAEADFRNNRIQIFSIPP